MFHEVLKSKIHRAAVTDADLNYIGSITIDDALLRAANIKEFEKVHVVNLNNGARIETYTLSSPQQGVICLNGAAARFFHKGDIIIIMSYTWINHDDSLQPKVVFVNQHNLIVSQGLYASGGGGIVSPLSSN
jgi:aspartate 1-decarboxylase